MIFNSIDPFSQLLVAEHEVLTQSQLNKKLQLSERAFKNWKQTTFEQRALVMKKLADILRKKRYILILTAFCPKSKYSS